MKYLLLLVLYSTFDLNYASVLPPFVETFGTIADLYWRDYYGLVPTDAFAGGKNADGEITYIGQMNIPAEYNTEISKIHTIPVSITNGNQTAVGAYQGRTVISNDNSYVKIMCCNYCEGNFKWSSRQELAAPGCRYVVGGFEDAIPMLVGKAEHNKEIIIGKIFSQGKRHYTGLIIPYENGEFLPPTYEILMHC